VPIAALPGGGGLFSDLFGVRASAPAAATVGSAPMPPSDVRATPPARSGTASLDGWLLNHLFGRR